MCRRCASCAASGRATISGGHSVASGAGTKTWRGGPMAATGWPVNPSRLATVSPIPIPTTDALLMADTLTITDNRTGKQYEVPVTEGTIRATDLRQIKTAPEDPGLATYDPAFMNTSACRSRITYID